LTALPPTIVSVLTYTYKATPQKGGVGRIVPSWERLAGRTSRRREMERQARARHAVEKSALGHGLP
jgi:hypothetical protein